MFVQRTIHFWWKVCDTSFFTGYHHILVPPHLFQADFFSTPLVEQLDLAADVPVHCKRAGQDDLQRSFPAQMILWFCNSISGRIFFGFPSPPGLTGIYTGCCAPMGLSHGLGWKIMSCQLDMAASSSHSLCGVCSFWGVHGALLAPFLTPFCQTPCQWDTAEETCYQAAPSYAT